MPHMHSPVPKSSLELTEPHCNHCQESFTSPTHPYWSAPWWHIKQNPLYSHYSSWTNQLMSPFQKEFPAAIFFAFRLQKLATKPQKASALPDLSGGWPAVLAAWTLSLLFVVNELTHFCDTLCLVILFKPSLGSMTEWRLFTLKSFYFFACLFSQNLRAVLQTDSFPLPLPWNVLLSCCFVFFNSFFVYSWYV